MAEWFVGLRFENPEWACAGDSFLPAHDVTNVELAGELTRMLAAMPQAESALALDESHADDVAHDAYFHVLRVQGCAPLVFARMALSARLILLREVAESPVTLDSHLLGLMDRGLADLIECVSGERMRSVARWETSGSASRPMTRWVHGHQIFAALSQGLIFSFLSLGRAIRAGQGEQVRRWAGLCASLLQGAGAAFLFTGDFSAKEYSDIVRSSMMPPSSPVSLSGLMSEDHRFLMQTLRDMRPALRSLHEQEPALHDRLQQELSTVYDRHIHVCERFVGEKPSLLTARHAKKSGPKLIEQFKALRMKSFDSTTHVPRLVTESETRIVGAPGADQCPFVETVPIQKSATEACPAVAACPKDV